MKKTIAVIFILALNLNASLALDINKGIGLSDEALEEQLFTTSIPYAIARQGQRSINTSSVQAYIDLGDSVYSLSSKLDLIQTNKSDRKIIANWPLTRWKYQYYPDERIEIFTSLGRGNQDFGKPYYNSTAISLGCYGQQPLQYGSLAPTGDKELFLFLSNQLIIFSPKYGRTVFSEIFDNSDWINAADTTALVERNTRNETPQFASDLIANNGGNAEPGMRYYSKIFIGDFDKDGNTDILVWRKYYKSNLRSDPVPGFTLKSNNWQHFERDLKAQAALPAGVTGEYLPQQTDATTIQTWLSDNNLTWQKGYPDFSECKGQKGKLIPEMHDPLLNDPDVLK